MKCYIASSPHDYRQVIAFELLNDGGFSAIVQPQKTPKCGQDYSAFLY